MISRQTSLPIAESPQPFTIDEIARLPLPGMAIPGSLCFSPDGRLLTYLWSREGSLTRQLYAYDLQTGQTRPLVSPPGQGATDDNVSLEETLRRERARQREFGVTSYSWAARANRLLVPLRGDIYVQDHPEAPLRKIFDGQDRPALDPQFSPDGALVAFVRESELYVIPASGGAPRQVTSGARETGKTHGLAEFIAQEEMDRSRGFWWSPDGRRIAFEEVDETHIPVYRIMHQGKDFTGAGAQEDHRYPFAGAANARVRLGVVSIDGGEPVWMDLGADEDIYLARVDWLPDGRLTAQVEDRSQTRLDLIVFDPDTGTGRVLLNESTRIWINLHNLFRPLKNGGFIWASERSGYRHLYLYDAYGSLLRQLTRGDWPVDDIVGIDEEAQTIYFTAGLESPLESQLYAVTFSGREPQRITPEYGTHTIVMDSACTVFADSHHNLENPPSVHLRALPEAKIIHTLYQETDPRIAELDLRPPEIIKIKNKHGDLLFGAVYRPPERFGKGPYPTIVSVYGGPHAQTVVDGWGMTANMRQQYLRSQGFLVFQLDNRGSARRGLDFEGQVRRQFGRLEVEDQVAGVKWLVEQGLADPQRVGIYGWSFGGYMTLMCLANAPETFSAGVAGAPVTAWDGYDTHYTERYMGTPQNNPDGYARSSVMHHVANLQGKLLLVHGMIDENVHFRHTARLINALIDARKPYDLLLFPDERHMPRKSADRAYMEQQISAYFQEHLVKNPVRAE